ncbi:MAG TPA: P-loop NTPase, partial [Candidatus Hodarchaeales archaeon]|nr:P-loop NTPase [Candidatus Hodarchaeales archaeon]
DVQKGIRMFTQEGLNLDILGIVENMAYFVCDQCNKKSYIFDQRGAKVIADGFGLEILGNIPLVTDLRVSGDEGIPIVIKNPNHAVSKSFIDMAELVSARIAQRNHEQAKKKEKVVINLDMAT